MINPKNADVWYNRGVLYRDASKFDDAIRDFTKTLSVDPKYADALFNRGQIYSDRKDFDRAIAAEFLAERRGQHAADIAAIA